VGGGDKQLRFIDGDAGVCGGGVGSRGSGMFISVYNGSSSWMLMWWIVASESKFSKCDMLASDSCVGEGEGDGVAMMSEFGWI
jgi:hypothetical protein